MKKKDYRVIGIAFLWMNSNFASYLIWGNIGIFISDMVWMFGICIYLTLK